MPHFAFDYAFHIAFSAPVRLHNYLLRCAPRVESFQKVERLHCSIQGEKVKTPYTLLKRDSFGNILFSGNDVLEHESFSLHVTGIVQHTPYRICDHVHGMYRVASARTVCTPEMLAFLEGIILEHQAWVAQGGQASCNDRGEGTAYGVYSLCLHDSLNLHDSVKGQITHSMVKHYGKVSYEQFNLACAIAYAVHKRLSYVPQSTHVDTLAGEAFALNAGVCQDYAHITIALCRMAGIPARYACGFISGEGVSHAWLEVYIHGVWYGIDPTQNRLIHYAYIKVAHGRDSADCPMNRGTFCSTSSNSCTQETSISVKVNPL